MNLSHETSSSSSSVYKKKTKTNQSYPPSQPTQSYPLMACENVQNNFSFTRLQLCVRISSSVTRKTCIWGHTNPI